MTATPTKPARRPLSFRSLDDVARDVDALRAAGYDRAGNWNLAQVCSHLADWMSFPLDGFPKLPAPLRPIFWLMRHTVARRGLRRALATNTMAAGVPTLPATVTTPDADEDASVENLRRMIDRFDTHTGPVQPSPMFGDIDYETAKRLQLVHCAHHLSFLVPKAR